MRFWMIVCDMLLLYVGGGVAIRPAFSLLTHAFLYIHFFTTPLSCLLRTLVLLSVVILCLCTTKFVCADFLSHKFFCVGEILFVTYHQF